VPLVSLHLVPWNHTQRLRGCSARILTVHAPHRPRDSGTGGSRARGADIAPSLYEAGAMSRAARMWLMAAMFELQATIPHGRSGQ
jgi:hypothetical protein